MAVILCTGVDSIVTKTRRLILEQAGHTVILAHNDRDVEEACFRYKFDIAVIGQNIPTRPKHHVNALIRSYCPAIKVLELRPPYVGRALEDADAWLEMPPETPQLFIDVVNSLASKAATSSAKS